jgi:purine-nucleoside phosphorylase
MSDASPQLTLSRLDEAATFLRSRTAIVPALGIVAGSGLGALAGLVLGRDPAAVRIPYAEIPHALAPTVIGHAGELVIGRLAGLPVAILSGRVHGYEGHGLDEVVFNVRLVARLGAKRFLVTNAAGGVDPWLLPGALCRIVDHLNLTGKNPLVGPNVAALGPRFPDMSRAYDPELGLVLERAAATAGVPLFAGIYAGLSGPSYETPAEIRMLRVLGANLVGMSTVHEVIALSHMGVKVAGLSCVTNHAAGVSSQALDHSEVASTANEAGPRLLALVEGFCALLAEAPGQGESR